MSKETRAQLKKPTVRLPLLWQQARITRGTHTHTTLSHTHTHAHTHTNTHTHTRKHTPVGVPVLLAASLAQYLEVSDASGRI